METTLRSPPSADNLRDQSASRSSFKMIDVGAKEATHRLAIARGTIKLSPAAFLAVLHHENPKGDVLALAEVAAILGAKKTAEWLPLCHPIPIEKIRVRFEPNPEDHSFTIFCEVSTTAKTGVEMEALCAVNAGLLAVYDLSKAVDPVISISDIRLDRKEGGKSGLFLHPDFDASPEISAPPAPEKRKHLEGFKSALITVSDRCSRGEVADRSGPAASNYLAAQGSEMLPVQIVPDEAEEIQEAILKTLAHSPDLNLLVLCGGTGLSPRDHTPEAVRPLYRKIIPGIGELLRSSGSKQTPMAYLSRSEAGLIGNTLVVSLPGSERAVLDGLSVLAPLLKHACEIIGGGSH